MIDRSGGEEHVIFEGTDYFMLVGKLLITIDLCGSYLVS